MQIWNFDIHLNQGSLLWFEPFFVYLRLSNHIFVRNLKPNIYICIKLLLHTWFEKNSSSLYILKSTTNHFDKEDLWWSWRHRFGGSDPKENWGKPFSYYKSRKCEIAPGMCFLNTVLSTHAISIWYWLWKVFFFFK